MSRLAMIPSAHDQLSPIVAGLRWWSRTLASVAPQRNGDLVAAKAFEREEEAGFAGPVRIALSPADAFKRAAPAGIACRAPQGVGVQVA